MVPDFNDEQTLVGKQRIRLAQYHAHGVKPVLAARERDGRFVAVLARKLAHGVRAYVRRIRDNEIVVLAAHCIEHIRPQHAHPALQLMVRDVASRNRERAALDVHRIDRGTAEGFGEHDREAAGTGAQVESPAYAQPRRQPRHEALMCELGNERARHDHAFVDIKPVFAQPGLAREIGGGHTSDYARVDEFRNLANHTRRYGLLEIGGQPSGRQLQRVEHEVSGFIPCGGYAVTIREPRAREARAGGFDQGMNGGDGRHRVRHAPRAR